MGEEEGLGRDPDMALLLTCASDPGLDVPHGLLYLILLETT